MLKKDNRLKKASDFQAAYKYGKYVVARQVVIYYLYHSSRDQVRVGFVASKKVGPSHIRNRCKRMLREAMRPLVTGLPPGYDLVVVARPPLADESVQVVSQVLTKLLRKAKLSLGRR